MTEVLRGSLYFYWSSTETTLNLDSALSVPSLFLYLIWSESSLEELDGDSERWISSILFPFAFLASRSMSFLQIFWSLFRWGTSFFISASIVWRFTATLRSFSFRVFFQRFSHFALRPWSLFDLIREGLFSRSLESLSLLDIMLDLCFTTEEVFKYWLNFTVILWWQR